MENRARLLLEVTDAAISVWGAGRVGVHLSPRCDMHSMGDSDPLATFGYVAEQLGQRQVAFIFTREAQGADAISPALKRRFGGVLIANENFTAESAVQAIANGDADAVSFGKHFIANPDLPRRLQIGAPLTPFDAATFYLCGAEGPSKGYTDYPFLED